MHVEGSTVAYNALSGKKFVLCLPDDKSGKEIASFLSHESVAIELRIIIGVMDRYPNTINKRYQKVHAAKNKVYEMRFTRQGRNARIYCLETDDTMNGLRVVIGLLLTPNKKSNQKIDKKVWQNIVKKAKITYQTTSHEQSE